AEQRRKRQGKPESLNCFDPLSQRLTALPAAPFFGSAIFPRPGEVGPERGSFFVDLERILF
ncbi:MAG: hypothetical protein U0K65_04405, partial [Negativibacillus sp.]|nr:hypothetical protein [Negativibacillus sp.]